MAIVTPDDVGAGLKTAWDTNAALPGLVPGGLWHQRPKVEALVPYAAFTVKETEPENFSGTTYIAKFVLSVKVWDKAKNSKTGTIANALDGLATYQALTIPNAVSLVHIRPTGGELTKAPEPRDAEDMLLAERTWEVWVNATRP